MKKINKIISTILSASIALTMVSGISITATEDISVELDGTQITFDVNPQIIDGRTMVPLRKIFEEIGALVKWDNDTQTVTARKSSKTVTLSIGSDKLTIDKGDKDSEGNAILETVTLDVPAQIVSGRTLVPTRAISESFGFNVYWDEYNQKVLITSDDDGDDSWKENTGTINLSDLSYTGNGIEITDNQILITAGGDFTLTGTLADGNITISTKEKVKLRLSGAKITSSSNPCIFIEDADKAYITITEDTDNTLVSKNSDNGAIYSKDNLEIKGKGILSIMSSGGHGIKASDNLAIENGNINIDATSDGIHVNDTFKMIGGKLNITAVGDGIDSESIVDISGGTINIETTGVPIETTIVADTAQTVPKRGLWEETTNVEFEKSSKGINAEWMTRISGGKITVDSASHAIHCQDEIQIDGGEFSISSKYEKGISAHGNLTVSGNDTSIDITKSAEGIESKNIMTINAGIIKVVSTDDAINATGGNSGTMEMPRGNFGTQTEPENRVNPERNEKAPVNQPEQTTNGEQIKRRPGGGENGQFGVMIPSNEITANGGFTPSPPYINTETDEFTPPFEDGNNGEFTLPDRTMPQMNDGAEMPGGNNGNNGRNMKDCLVINGGYLELYAEDDCLDSNGNLVINGGTIKATNPTGSFAGTFAVIDADGKTTISENSTLIFAAESGEERSLNLPQNTIIVYCESSHNANDKITVADADGDIIYEYTPLGKFSAVLISSEDLILGQTYTITIGEEKYETVLSGQSTVIGTKKGGNKGFEREWIMK